MKWLSALFLASILFLAPAAAQAQEGDSSEPDDVVMHIRGDVHLAAGESVATIVVIDGNAVVDGTVAHNLVVINGNATVSGSVGDNITVIKGNIDLRSTAVVNNVVSIRGDVIRDAAATVSGDVQERDDFAIATTALALFSILFWIGMTVAVIVAGLIFAAVGGSQLRRSAQTMTGDAVASIIGVVAVWVAIPVVAGIAFATLIGIPLGFGLLLFLLPALWFLGYIVAGARLGGWLVGLTGRDGQGEHPFAATALGLILLQLGVLVPVIGIVVALLAGIWGAGALAACAYRAASTRGKKPEATSPLPSAPGIQGTPA